MSVYYDIQEYRPGEYCKSIQCPQYNNGDFDSSCNKCKAFTYYQWLKQNKYRLLLITRVADR